MKTKKQLKKSIEHWQAQLAGVTSEVIERQAHMNEIQLLLVALRIEYKNARS